MRMSEPAFICKVAKIYIYIQVNSILQEKSQKGVN
jgi:hypothetical protein